MHSAGATRRSIGRRRLIWCAFGRSVGQPSFGPTPSRSQTESHSTPVRPFSAILAVGLKGRAIRASVRVKGIRQFDQFRRPRPGRQR